MKKNILTFLLLFIMLFTFFTVNARAKSEYTIDDYFDFIGDDEDRMLLCSYKNYKGDDEDDRYHGAFMIYAVTEWPYIEAVSFCRNCGEHDSKKYSMLNWGELYILDLNDLKGNTYSWTPNWYGFLDGNTLHRWGNDHEYWGEIETGFSVNAGKSVSGTDAVENRVRTRFAREGICPRFAYVSVHTKGYKVQTGVDGLYFSNESDYESGGDPNSTADYSSVIAWSKFQQDSAFTTDYNACLTQESVSLYKNAFSEFDKYQVGLHEMYKKNGICDIAKGVYNNTLNTSTCEIKDEELNNMAHKIITNPICLEDEEPIPDPTKCSSYFGNINDKGSTAYYLDKAFTFISYAGVAVLIVTLTIDYIKALTSGDKDTLKKVNTRSIKRIIFAILLFLLPLLLRTVLPIFGIVSDCEIAGIKG